MEENARHVGIVMYQFSVVVKSMEKGLADKGYGVTLLKDDIESHI